MHAYASMLVSVDTVYHYSLKEKVETQNFASHKEVVQILSLDYRMRILQWIARETHGMKIWRVTTSNIN